MKKILILLLMELSSVYARDKEIALSFDDAPIGTSLHFETTARSEELIRKLKVLNVPPVIIFSNPCKREDSVAVIEQLKKYKSAGHLIGNHTCSHPRLDEVGFVEYSKDAAKGDLLLAPLLPAQKFFRYPFLNEGSDVKTRDEMRAWLVENKYRNGFVSIDNDDYLFSFKINQAKERGKKINYDKVKALFIKHIIGAADFYDDLAIKTLGRSPKHVILLHEMDATVMFIDSLVMELKKRGWKIISAEEAYSDKMYSESPQNTYANNGIIAQLSTEKTGMKVGYNHFDELKVELNKILRIEKK